MSALTTLIAILNPLAEPAVKAVVKLVEGALAGRNVQAEAEAVATLNGYKGAISAAAELRREQIRNAVRRVALFNTDGSWVAYVHVAGTPRVVSYGGKHYVAFPQDHGITNSFREAEHEEGVS